MCRKFFQTWFCRNAPNDHSDNLMLVDEEFKSTLDYGKISLGRGGPIATLDGEVVVGISTEIDIIYPLHYSGCYGTINAMGIEEALSKVGYPKKMILGIINR
ncbi:hypothetical protein KFK09_006835 [Dendrobium nobile]|uniref:Uncharacterized protein n=1 Tax=Dendrobium nobile TaxID=94219 RepID=A0A8T3BSN6_DENNO|nr:hypothetical protein KFK09_006835 [Dendrobium nobile]